MKSVYQARKIGREHTDALLQTSCHHVVVCGKLEYRVGVFRDEISIVSGKENNMPIGTRITAL
jgi:hypothetical protein